MAQRRRNVTFGYSDRNEEAFLAERVLKDGGVKLGTREFLRYVTGRQNRNDMSRAFERRIHFIKEALSGPDVFILNDGRVALCFQGVADPQSLFSVFAGARDEEIYLLGFCVRHSLLS